jgi:hypothetical protein
MSLIRSFIDNSNQIFFKYEDAGNWQFYLARIGKDIFNSSTQHQTKKYVKEDLIQSIKEMTDFLQVLTSKNPVISLGRELESKGILVKKKLENGDYHYMQKRFSPGHFETIYKLNLPTLIDIANAIKKFN